MLVFQMGIYSRAKDIKASIKCHFIHLQSISMLIQRVIVYAITLQTGYNSKTIFKTRFTCTNLRKKV